MTARNIDKPPFQVAARRILGGIGSLLAASAVALSAYAAHGVEAAAQGRLMQAAAFAFAHGLALAALSPLAQRRTALFALAAMLLGTLLFAGSLIGGALFGLPTTLAPFGGTLLIVAWLAHGCDRLRG
ncbi:MAG: DUF423 domain-containing protein [Thermomonas sp.]|uniref:DUF423 domain-containing protein n=1 Tax=Thermomonas sp. TaxID=1971895 RepID=UPI0039E41290